jgi:DNA-binding protein YbaB
MPALGDSLAYQLDELATARMSSDDGRAAMRELLSLLESVEQRVDEATAQLRTQTAVLHTGYNTSHDVSVTINAGGMVSDVSYNRHWLADTPASTIGRETVSAFQDARRRASVDSPGAGLLGEVQALSQDPFGLARRLHLRD